ncbi:hypothetical protein [Pseudomonas sp. REB1044]|uniref:hypothetical protein n=1 Tax=Pseudomonas sp. REB1044 TaxID=2675224 RepID=UPI00315C7572
MILDATYQRITSDGLLFCMSRFTVHPGDRSRLQSLFFLEAKGAQYRVSCKVIEVYDYMQAGNRPCVMTVGISSPLTRRKGDSLNARRATVINLSTSATAGVAGWMGGFFASATAGLATRKYVDGAMPTYHAGDILVSVEAEVSGGIGPQRTSQSLIISV